MTRPVALLIATALTAAAAAQPSVPAAELPPTAERAYNAVAARFDRDAAMNVVRHMQQYWRLAGNPGYNASIDHIRGRLLKAGVQTRVDEYAKPEPGWDYSRGTVTIDGDPTPILSKERDRVSLAINSFSTPPGGISLPLVDVGAAATQDFSGKTVKGTLVLGDASLGRLWQQAVRNRGAAGVVSTEIAPYIRPSDPSALSEAQKDVLQWGGIPFDPALKTFGFKASWRAASRLRAALARRPDTRVRVDIESAFHPGPNRTLVSEIVGRSRPHERIVVVAHLQEPGANDNASGCATLLSVVLALNEAIRRGTISPPERTMTFLWLDEIRGSRQWLTARKGEAAGVQYMFSMDMTGEDTAKTGGTFLIEKQADPSAVWPRPSDPHSEWGASQVTPESLKGSLLNDVHIAVAQRRARDTRWTVRTNPYEGGSDHTAFAAAGIPSLLNWHFTDRYYHTNQDTTDKVSADEMRHVGVTVATSAYFLASATESDALAVVDVLERSAGARLALERRQGPVIVAKAPDRAAAEKVEQQLMAAWRKWYGEALDSVAGLPAAGTTAVVKTRIDSAKRGLK